MTGGSDRLQDGERLRRQKGRSLAIGLGLGLLVLLFYAATIVRLGPNALKKDGFGTPAAVPTATATPPTQAACKKAGTCP